MAPQAVDAQQQRVEFVGPQVGKELYENGALALLLVCIGIVAYLALRFEWRFAVSAIIANLHDVVIILGFFALVPVGILAAGAGGGAGGARLFGQRVGRHRRPDPRELPQDAQGHRPDVINNAITSTMSRTIITHGCTLMMVLSILFFGGETLHYFALALTIGICFGIYSSVLVMAPLVMWLGVSREDLVKPERKAGAGRREDPALTAAGVRFDLDRSLHGLRRSRTPAPPHADHAALFAVRARPDVAHLAAQYGALLFAALFLVIFAETGLVVFPLLPGDSLLFIAGTVVAASGLNVHLLVLTLFVAAVLGDSVNYAVGHYIGPKAFNDRRDPTRRWLKQEYLERTQRFYEKYGGVHDHHRPLRADHAHVCAVPRRRRGMTYRKFLSYNVVGGGRLGRLARLRRLPVRQHPVGQAEPRWIVVGIVIVVADAASALAVS